MDPNGSTTPPPNASGNEPQPTPDQPPHAGPSHQSSVPPMDAASSTPAAIPTPPPSETVPNMPADQPPMPWQSEHAVIPQSTPMPPVAAVSSPAPATADTPDLPFVAPSARTRRSRKWLLIAVSIAVLVLTMLAILYAIFFGSSKKETPRKASTPVDLATLQSAALNPPNTVPGYKLRETGTASIKDFVSTDNTCEVIVGTATAAQLPGANLNAIIEPQLQQLRAAGAVVDGPHEGSALVIKESGGDNSYRMPTLNFAFSQGNKHATIHYSAVILRNGDRAFVNRSCVNANGQVSSARMQAADAIAKQVTVGVPANK